MWNVTILAPMASAKSTHFRRYSRRSLMRCSGRNPTVRTTVSRSA